MSVGGIGMVSLRSLLPSMTCTDVTETKRIPISITGYRKIAIRALPDSKILDIKKQIEEKSGIAPNKQNLYLNKQRLHDDKHISDYNIAASSIIKLQLYEYQDDIELNQILRANDLYNDLHQKLHDNHIGLEKLQKLQNKFKDNDAIDFCDKLSLNMKQKLKFRKLMRIIISNQSKMQTIPNTTCRSMEVLLIGDYGVGKTSLIQRYIHDTFYQDTNSSIGVDYMEKQETLSDDSIMTLNIWDTAGQEKYQSVVPNYYRKSDCIVICYDVDNQQSFDNCNKWRQQIEEYTNDDVIVILVGCKSDLLPHNRVKYEAKAQEIIEQTEWNKLSTVYCECSSKTNDNVHNVFLTIAELENKKQKKKILNDRHSKLSNEAINRHDIISTKIGQIDDDSCKYTNIFSKNDICSYKPCV